MENDQQPKKEPSGFWARVKNAKLLAGLVGSVLTGMATMKGLSSCAGAKPETKLASNASISSTATSSPTMTATASPTITVSPSLTVTVPPPAPSATPAAPTITKYDVRSDHQSGGVTAGQYIYEGAEKEEVRKVKAQLEAIRDYSEVARLTFKGLPVEFSGGGDIVFSTALSNSMKPAFEEIDANHSHFGCSDTALAALQNTKDRFPKFPFSYYGLAYCLMKAGDTRWRGYALTLSEILEQTTTIAGHAPDHDQALKESRAALSGQ